MGLTNKPNLPGWWLLLLPLGQNHHFQPTPVLGHGYLATPRSRNLLAFQETVWWPQTSNDPEPETCPHCLNLGGSRARCGMTQDTSGGLRNYDTPRNALLGPMPTKIQATYVQGQDVVLDVTLTAHHKGHFVFSACPISSGEIPTQECFDANRLTFVEDLLYGANYDPNYPERAYLHPVNDPGYVPDLGSAKSVMDFSFKMRLPPDLYGDLVLIQWYYLTANSCYHDGYQEYNWPSSWDIDATSSDLCGDVSSDGTGVPEQFWNCAEVKIERDTNISIPPNNPNTPPVNIPSTPMDISSGISIPVGLPSSSQAGFNSSPSLSSTGSHGKTIVGYYASWQWYDRNKKAAPANMDFTKLQRVNFAFFQIDAQGNMWGTDAWADPNLLFGPMDWNPSAGSQEYCSWDSATVKACNHHNYEQGLIHLVHAAGAEIYPSLGGWTLSDPFPPMAASASARATFSQNCVDLIKEYGFDGIDIDWEYPGYEEHSGTPSDRDNFKLLLNDVRAKLDELGAQTGKFYGLTAALPCGPQHIANMDIAHVASTLSELNLMTYDFHGAFSPVTGTNAPLYYQGWGEQDFDVHSCVQNWLAGGGSRDKINIGLPFYGRSFGGATGLNEVHSGADQAAWGIDDGYAYFADGGLVSFDDENAICAKVQYAQEHNLGGFIIWEISGDLMDDLSTPLLDVTNKKLLDPNYDCGEAGVYPGDAAPGTSPGIPVPTPAVKVPTLTTPINPTMPTVTTPTNFIPTPTVQDPTLASPNNPTMPTVAIPINPIPGSYPTPFFPTFPTSPVSNPEIHNKPSEPALDQPEPVNDKPLLLRCGDRRDTFDINDSKALDLSFRYELHRYSSVSISDATQDFKSSLLNGLAGKLRCTGALDASSAGRSLRNNPVEASQENVMAIASTQSDLPGNDIPCSIPLNLDVPTVCNSLFGSVTAYVDKRASAKVLTEVAEELIFYIRTSMNAGQYESAKVRKVIFVENVSPSRLESNAAPPNTNIVWKPQNDEGNSPVIAIVFSLLLIFLVGILLLMHVIRKRREDSRYTEHTPIVENKPEDAASATMSATMPESTSMEETLSKALGADEVWRNALNTYESKSTILPVDPDEEALDPNASRGTILAEPLVQHVTRDDEVAYKSLAENDNDRLPSEPDMDYYNSDVKVDHDESFAAFDEMKKRRKKKKKKKRRPVDRDKMPLEPEDSDNKLVDEVPLEIEEELQGPVDEVPLEPKEELQDSENKLVDDHNVHERNIEDEVKASELVGVCGVDELAENKEEENNQDNEMDGNSFGSSSEGNIYSALDGEKDENNEDELLPTTTIGEKEDE
ncbi:hypothetical protein ACHAXR_009440, partial [Thalassiosira sp. AJA248-18]